VTVYIVGGAFTLPMAGRGPATATAGRAVVERADVGTTAFDGSATRRARPVVFHASNAGVPFPDPVTR
jgi:hypothetical protein